MVVSRAVREDSFVSDILGALNRFGSVLLDCDVRKHLVVAASASRQYRFIGSGFDSCGNEKKVERAFVTFSLSFGSLAGWSGKRVIIW